MRDMAAAGETAYRAADGMPGFIDYFYESTPVTEIGPAQHRQPAVATARGRPIAGVDSRHSLVFGLGAVAPHAAACMASAAR